MSKEKKRKADDGGINNGLHHFSVGKITDTLCSGNRDMSSKVFDEQKGPDTKSHYFLSKLLSAADRNSIRKKVDTDMIQILNAMCRI